MSWLFWLFVVILLAAGAVAAFMAYRSYFGIENTPVNLSGWLFRQRPEPRLGVIEQAAVDSRRRLVLIRRDGVEHLIMTGGPVDVVIETGIHASQPQSSEQVARSVAEPSPPVFARQPRLGQAVNE
jgi:flagellar protein FliO/FliZ